MAIVTSWRSIEADMGIDFNATYPTAQPIPASNTSTALGNIEQAIMPGVPLGDCRRGTNNSDWVLVKASTTITQFNVVTWDDSFNANNFTSALGLTGQQIGVAQFQKDITSGSAVTSADPGANPVFWAAIRGDGMQVNVSGSAATGVPINNAITPGSVTINATASASGSGMHGIILMASAGASGAVECQVLYPHWASFT
jgi:hypothetical protein